MEDSLAFSAKRHSNYLIPFANSLYYILVCTFNSPFQSSIICRIAILR